MDRYEITGPDGNALNIASWIRADPGPDFGIKDLPKAEFSENAAAEGGVLGFESVGVRHFAFPLLLASSSLVAGGLPGLAGYLRRLARPGAYIDLQVEHVAAGDTVRFDVLAGRLDEDYSIPLQRSPRREALLRLDVQPYGYSPSLITLASAASVGLPGTLAIPAASFIGDVPGLADLTISPTARGTAYPAGSWLVDALAWSLAGRASFQAYWGAGSVGFDTSFLGYATVIGDRYAVSSQAAELTAWLAGAGAWHAAVFLDIPNVLEPAYRGRFRIWSWLKFMASQSTPFEFSADAVSQHLHNAALASTQPIATVRPAVGDSTSIGHAWASPGFQLVDLGEHSLPPEASGMKQDLRLRLWAKPPATGNLSSPPIHFGGFYLLPLDGPAGILARGLIQPTTMIPSSGGLYLDAISKRGLNTAPTGNIGSVIPRTGALGFYRGALPAVGASTISLNLLYGARSTASGPTGPLIHSTPAYAAVSVRYRPRFAFLKSV